MSMEFPLNPVIGQQHPTVNPRFQWSGTAWDAIGGSGVPGTATPVTRRLTVIDGNVDFIGLDGTGPALVASSVIATYAGGSPPPSAPAVMTVGQWTVTPIAGGIAIDIDVEPAGSPTGYERSLDNGVTWAALANGAALGVRNVTGLAQTELQTRVRAVNAVGPAPNPGSDTKAVTPLAGGGGGAAYIEETHTTGFNSIIGTRPAGVTAGHTLVAVAYNANGNGSINTMPAPEGWFAGPGAVANARGFRVFTAPGDVPLLTFAATGIQGLLLIGVTAPVIGTPAILAVDSTGDGGTSNYLAPGVPGAPAGALGVSVYIQLDDGIGGALAGTPQADWSRPLLENTATPRVSVLARANLPAGDVPPVSHAAAAAFATRHLVTFLAGS
jgi:hypothetical protein